MIRYIVTIYTRVLYPRETECLPGLGFTDLCSRDVLLSTGQIDAQIML